MSLTPPSSAIGKITNALKNKEAIITVPAKKRLALSLQGKKYLYILLSGEISLLRKTDLLLLGSISEKYIFGLTGLFFSPKNETILRTDTACQMVKIEVKEAASIIAQCGLWYHVSEILSFHIKYMIHRDAMLVNKRTREVVIGYIEEIARMPDDERSKIKMLQYIQERSGISRSSIMNIIAEMRNDNVIHTRRGGILLATQNILASPLS
ncbi:helix-turn-helix domain-containing protein [Scandinavium goeteborgense]|uniref:helix-turn-helix domain-containing protein n=1 Tax=Scandinavium goeteborgense TaxID=1851514 RepID=UPI00216533F5|nr:helix-turn-helix domain-containing protein [Scandinavium goeteborgense]MCS2153108.1 helix-turn-helix domain-containing protein [Scandinavium goeteborgense]